MLPIQATTLCIFFYVYHIICSFVYTLSFKTLNVCFTLSFAFHFIFIVILSVFPAGSYIPSRLCVTLFYLTLASIVQYPFIFFIPGFLSQYLFDTSDLPVVFLLSCSPLLLGCFTLFPSACTAVGPCVLFHFQRAIVMALCFVFTGLYIIGLVLCPLGCFGEVLSFGYVALWPSALFVLLWRGATRCVLCPSAPFVQRGVAW